MRNHNEFLCFSRFESEELSFRYVFISVWSYGRFIKTPYIYTKSKSHVIVFNSSPLTPQFYLYVS